MLLELPSRWYLGRVTARTMLTVTLAEALCGHDLGDLGMFLDGELNEESEITPLPRPIELSLSSLDSAQPYPAEHLAAVSRRTHQKLKKKGRS